MARASCGWRVSLLWIFVVSAWVAGSSPSRGETVRMKNGMAFEGSYSPLLSIGGDPLNPTSDVQRIVLIDNQLTRTFVGRNQVDKIDTPPPTSIERFKVDQKVANSGRTIGSIGQILNNDPFDEWGRRIFSMRGPQGRVDIVQGITEIAPVWTKIEAIQGEASYVLTMRIATSSIPREQLSRILFHVIDPKNPDQRLRLVRLYLQMERFQYARQELDQVLKDFPNLAHLEEQRKILRQLETKRLLTEIDARLDAGQFRLGVAALEQFPAEGVAGETLLKVREMLQEMEGFKAAGAKSLTLIKELYAALQDESDRTGTKAIVEEIKRDLNINTLDRMADVLRLADDKSLKPEQKLSLAISGWLMGSGSGVESLAVSKSLVQIRDLVQQYLATGRKPDRDIVLTKLTSLEGATAPNIARLIAHMRPPLANAIPPVKVDVGNPAKVLGLTPNEPNKPAEKKPEEPKGAEPKAPEPQANEDEGCAPPKNDGKSILDDGPKLPPVGVPNSRSAPKAEPKPPETEPKPAPAAAETPNPDEARRMETPNLYELTAPGLPEDPQIKYLVQLPPDYDTYRRYPCIVTLSGAGTTPEEQIAWWAGDYVPKIQMRSGQATRHGYIVIAPRWTAEHQYEYQYSAREHAAVLRTLSHAYKRFAIDTDRVFLSGHSMGGDAAWDIGLAHPDLWAGLIPIVAKADKYVKHKYRENGKLLPMYFVAGEKDGNKWEVNADEWDHDLRTLNYDATVVQYQGRGHEPFNDEIQNIFAWMNLHKRNFFPKEFTTYTLRPWDCFFWFVELDKDKLLESNRILPAEWGKKATPAKTEGKILPTNTIHVDAGTSKATVWLAPDMVNFEARANVRINGKTIANIQPSVPTLLEDVRSRGDRQHPFWAKAKN